jgi:hypothetical protein
MLLGMVDYIKDYIKDYINVVYLINLKNRERLR